MQFIACHQVVSAGHSILDVTVIRLVRADRQRLGRLDDETLLAQERHKRLEFGFGTDWFAELPGQQGLPF